MGAILDLLQEFFTADGWPYTQLQGRSTLRTAYKGDNAQCTCYARAREDAQQLVFYSLLPVNVPEDKRLAVAELLTRINCGLIIGNFELDFEDGEVRAKTSIDVENDRLSKALIKQMVYANVFLMDDYIPAIMRTFALGREGLDATGKIERLLGELAQTIRFYNDSHHDAPIRGTTPIYLTGRLLGTPEAVDIMRSALERTVERPVPPIPAPESLPAAEYMTNLGLALKKVH